MRESNFDHICSWILVSARDKSTQLINLLPCDKIQCSIYRVFTGECRHESNGAAVHQNSNDGYSGRHCRYVAIKYLHQCSIVR